MEKGTKCQWIKGDFFGNIEVFENSIEEDGLTFYVFESGKRCSMTIFYDYMTLNIDSIATNVFNNQVVQQTTKSENPISPLVRDQLKQNSSKIILTLEIPVIKKDLFDILSITYKDMFDILIDNILKEYVSIDGLKKQLESKLKIYYSSKTNSIDTEVLEVDVQEFN